MGKKDIPLSLFSLNMVVYIGISNNQQIIKLISANVIQRSREEYRELKSRKENGERK